MVEIIYENKDWLPFFEDALKEIGEDYRLNFITEFELDIDQPPDNIVYLNRISPSSHTRGHREAFVRGEQYLEHLAAYNRRVINGSTTIDFELSKVAQYRLMKQFGLNYPPTIFGSDPDELAANAVRLRFPILTKHNCSGKGLGIRKCDDITELRAYLKSSSFEPSPDDVLLVQEYIKPKNDRITRVEIIDSELVYAFYSSTIQGFELCPADACATDRDGSIESEGLAGPVCDINSLFTLVPDFQHPLVSKYIEMCASAGFDMAGIEFIEAANGALYTYDINGTTNYSPDVEAASGNRAKKTFQRFIQKLVL